jgi:hypothetical protein
MEVTDMRLLAGAIILLAASICFAAGLLAEGLRQDRHGDSTMMGEVGALIFGVIGVVVVFAGMLDKRE